MITLTQPIDIEVKHSYIKEYKLNGLTLIEDDGNSITFKSYAQAATYLGLSKQSLYNLIRKNMKPIDVLTEIIKKY